MQPTTASPGPGPGTVGPSPVHPARVRVLHPGGGPEAAAPGPVVYWMLRDQRLADNWALLHAAGLAAASAAPLAVAFALFPKPFLLSARRRQLGFLLRGLRRLAADADARRLPFFLLTGGPAEVPALVRRLGASTLVADFSPLRPVREALDAVVSDLRRDAAGVAVHQVARARLYGFSEREISIVRALMMPEIESAYLERVQMQSTSLRDEFLQHFLREEPVVGIEYEAQLQKTLLPYISSAEVAKFAANFSTTSSCVIKIVEPRAHASLEDLKAVVLKVNTLEEEKAIPPWDEEQVPEEIVGQSPEPGSILDKVEQPGIGATEMILSNGMRICYKCTDFLDDQVNGILISGNGIHMNN